MPLTIGTQLGSHEITGLLGKGGMGEVYRARDTKLKREVAIKILPDEFSRDPDRVIRFQREAEVLASVNHPNIGAIYDLEEVNGSRFLVLELVEGETIAERIARGRILIDETLAIAKQIVDALEAAHERGIVHRDLKPANIKIAPDGKVKVLDFGLAKVFEAQSPSAALSNSPTMSTGSMGGMIVGTAAYMSPEQARGSAADQRADVFAFGSVVYEMLTGRQAFQGEALSDVLASVLKTEPDWTLLPPDLNARVREVLRRCLQKNPKDRWHAIADVRIELEVAFANPEGLTTAQASTVVPKSPLWRRAIPQLIALVVTAVVTSVMVWNLKPSPAPAAVAKFPILLGEGQRFTTLRWGTQIAISRDGTQIVYEANHQLYHRSLSDPEARPIPGTQTTQEVLSPVFSPDGRFIAYLLARSGGGSGGVKVEEIPVAGGVPKTLDQSAEFGASLRWSDEGILLGGTKGILRLSPNSSNHETVLEMTGGEIPTGPQMLPGGQAMLFTLGKGPPVEAEDSRIVVQLLKSGGPQILIDHANDARYLPTGHILYASGTSIFAVPFDARMLKLTGEPVRVLEGVRRSRVAAVQYGVSDNGTLIYVPGPSSTTAELFVPALMDRAGTVAPLNLPVRPYAFPRISPDGKRIAVQIDDGKQADIWIYELGGTHAPRQLTVGGTNRFPVWSADGTRVTFQSDREGDAGIFWQLADGNGAADRLTKAEPGVAHIPDSWSKDGELSFTAVKGSEGAVWIFSLKSKTSAVFAEAKSALIARSAFSPDGRWVVYQSNEGGKGRNRLWAQPFPAGGTRVPIVEGGQPFWSTDGAELFFNAGTGGLISKVKITTGPNFAFSDVIPVSQGELVNASSNNFPRNADTTREGKLIGLIDAETTKSGATIAPQIQVVLNWFQELK